MKLALRKSPNGLFKHSFPAFDNVFNNFFDDDIVANKWNGRPSVNISEQDDAFRIDVAAPGLEKEKFNIEVDKDLLTLSYEENKENSESTEKFTRKEFSYTSFKRSFHLPDTVEKEGIKAGYENGILQITIAKKEEAKDAGIKKIEIS